VTAQALIWSEELDAPLAWREGRPITRRAYLGDVHALARRLPAGGPMLNLTSDRYRCAPAPTDWPTTTARRWRCRWCGIPTRPRPRPRTGHALACR
jgi:hypothetical protein